MKRVISITILVAAGIAGMGSRCNVPRAAAGADSDAAAKKQISNVSMNETNKPSQEALSKLDQMQYHVTQQCGTEPPFRNAYWDNHKPGIYVDVVSGEPLFSSIDKFDSGTGWPSFMRPLAGTNVVEKEDATHGMVRTEVRSKGGNSHLGHLFDDGPAPTGQRYCINSASLRFIPVEKMDEEGYGEYLKPFVERGLIKRAAK